MSHESVSTSKTKIVSGRSFPARLRPYGRPALGLLLAAVAALAIGIFAKAEHETLAMTEGRFLALEGFLVLAAVGWLGRGFLPQMAAGATVFAALALPSNPTRSATLLLVLILGWMLAVAPLLRRRPGLSDFFFAALGLQALARPDLLLGPWGPRSAALVAMPALAALALHFLAEKFGSERTLLAFGAVALLAPGLNVNATLLLLAAAAGVYAGDEARYLPARWAAAAFLVLPLMLRWPFGLLASAAGLTLLAERRWPRYVAVPALVAAAVAAAVTGAPVGEPAGALMLAAALMPAAFAALGAERWRVAAGLLLIAGAAWLAAAPEGWAAGVLLLALAVPAERPVGAAQRAYFAVLLAGGLALAGFPWLRPEPVLEMADRLAPSPPFFLLAALLLVLVPGRLAEAFADRLAPGRLTGGTGGNKAWTWPPAFALAGLFVWLSWALPPAGRSLLGGQPQSLAEAQPLLRFAVGHGPFRQVVVDSQLFHGADLPAGQEVATLRLLAADGAELLLLPLRAGDDTADWAAARSDLERLPDFRAPSPWLSQVAPDGTFFSGRFRRRFDLPAPVAAAAIELVRATGLPAPTQIALHELELRP